jgi:NAD(P)-dependent dehydrogenase (short-subunit alcohol dehydrogenase family)
VKNGIFDLSGKVALITGGGSGIGRAYCEAMAEFGANVACAGRTEQKVKETVDLVSRFGHEAIAIKADISKPDEIEHMVHKTVEALGPIDIVFANAGITEPNWVKIHEKQIEEWDLIMTINLKSVFLLMRSVFPLMMKRKSGSFISTSSIGGLSPVTIPLTAGYNTAKAGLIMLTKVAARQYAEYGIRVNTICPGYHRTSILPKERIEEVEKALVSTVPMGRPGLPEEIKGLAVWLASDASSFVTGQVFIQDGGQIT